MRLIVDKQEEGGAFNATWFVYAPWAHPVWNSYCCRLYSLAECEKFPDKARLYREGMTHEFRVDAVDPSTPVDWDKGANEQSGLQLLHPPNYAYQIPCPDDETAFERVHTVMSQIERGRLSPDTDYRFVWDAYFCVDGVSLMNNQMAVEETVQKIMEEALGATH